VGLFVLFLVGNREGGFGAEVGVWDLFEKKK